MFRRDFISSAAAVAAGLSFSLGGRSLFAAGASAPSLNVKGANDRIALALVGCGGRGLATITACAKRNKNVVIRAVCDVNTTKLRKAAAEVERVTKSKPALVTTRMEDVFADPAIDAVWVATPEHWHVLAAIRALAAGKHVYVEKNPSINIWEGRQLVAAGAKYGRVIQVGFQNRSAPYAFSARDYIASGKLGSIVTVKCYNMLGGGKTNLPKDAPVPAWLGDEGWDRWLGPAPKVPFQKPGVTDENGRGNWGEFWAYSGGGLGDDASHVMDLARLVLGDPAHPKSVYCWGGNFAFGGKRETPEFQSIVYDFGAYSLSCDNAYATNYMTKTPGNVRQNKRLFPTWRNNSTRTEIYGTKGLMYLGRHGGGWQVLGPKNEIVAEDGGAFPDPEHQLNFIQALRGEAKPNGDAEQCHRSAVLVHLGNIAYRVGNKHLYFDAAGERFTGTGTEVAAANTLARGAYRKGYEVPALA